MSNMDDLLNKLREERMAREQARIQKLRELNLKKYPKSESQMNIRNNQSSNSKLVKQTSVSQKNELTAKNGSIVNGVKNVKNNFHVNGTTKRPVTAPVSQKIDYSKVKPKVVTKDASEPSKVKIVAQLHNSTRPAKKEAIPATTSNLVKKTFATIVENSSAEMKEIPSTSSCKTTSETDSTLIADKATEENDITKSDKSLVDNKVLTEIINPKIVTKNDTKSRKSVAVPTSRIKFDKVKPDVPRKSIIPQVVENSKSESVFERLYKPKYITKKPSNSVEKLKTDPNYLKKIVENADFVLNKRHTVFDKRPLKKNFAQRRSVSAVHFKRMSKNELSNCVHKWASIGDNLNKGDLEMNEDESIKEDKIVSAIKSERKKVQFMTPIPSNFNTPRPDELQARLKSWLQKRGKSLESYQHLHCFGINHLKSDLGTPKSIKFDDSIQTNKAEFDEENKENIALDSDSDNESFADTMDEPSVAINAGDKIDTVNWRNASIGSESVGFNDSKTYTDVFSSFDLMNVDELLVGALNDLAALLREGFDWQQAARWLRSIRSRFPSAPKNAAYWECRAALEDARGDLPASLQCWEQAIATGTEHSVVDSNLDQLLVKFMQLKISPQSGAPRQPDPKLVDVKNVFKSTIIRFAVQQAKLRRQSEQPSFTVTPVRRSARLSHCPPRTPLQIFESVRQAARDAPTHVFKPNDNFVHTP